MTAIDTTRLQQCIARYRSAIPGLADIARSLESASPDSLSDIYRLRERRVGENDNEFFTAESCQVITGPQQLFLNQSNQFFQYAVTA